MAAYSTDFNFNGQSNVQTSISFVLSGFLEVNGAINPPGDGSQAHVQVSVTLNGQTSNGSYVLHPDGTFTRQGMLASYTPNPLNPSNIQSGSLTLKPGNNTLSVSILVSADYLDYCGPNCGGQSAQAQYASTLKFAATDIFSNLPGGTTVNAPGLNIVNNQLVSVPEPAALSMGFLGLGLLIWKRTKTVGNPRLVDRV